MFFHRFDFESRIGYGKRTFYFCSYNYQLDKGGAVRWSDIFNVDITNGALELQ